jgi:excisionase family DNA binding protein
MNDEAMKLLARPTITVDQAAQVLGVSRISAYAAIRRGEIASISIGKRLTVPTAPLRRQLGLDMA